MVHLTSFVVQLAIAVIVVAAKDALPVKTNRCAGRICPAIYDPVCASNKVTYSNKCRFALARCELADSNPGKSPTLSIVRKGRCSDEPKVELCDGVCPEIFAPVCGSDNTTYGNLCQFQIAQCKAKMKGDRLVVDRKGRCEDIVTTREVMCPKACIKIYRPVCASDGKTYGNGCELEVAQCESRKRGGPVLTKVSDGRCKAAPEDSCRRPCNKMLRPVCASNGRSYGNECMLKNAACVARRNGEVLTMVSKGRCGEPKKKEAENNANCMRPCPRIFRPVCGSNNRTYGNSCLLSIAACRSRQAGQQLTVKREGRC